MTYRITMRERALMWLAFHRDDWRLWFAVAIAIGILLWWFDPMR